MPVQSKTDANLPPSFSEPCTRYERAHRAGVIAPDTAGPKVVRMRDDGA
ncbi:MAG: hypothetical protein WC590_03620 [Burkholderiaceae bacterium]